MRYMNIKVKFLLIYLSSIHNYKRIREIPSILCFKFEK